MAIYIKNSGQEMITEVANLWFGLGKLNDEFSLAIINYGGNIEKFNKAQDLVLRMLPNEYYQVERYGDVVLFTLTKLN